TPWSCCCCLFVKVPPPADCCPLSLHDALPIYCDHRALDDVGSRALHRRVDRAALRILLELAVARAREAGRLRRDRAGPAPVPAQIGRDTSELQSRENLVCRLLLEKKKDHAPPT